jgi:hypothetical protein
VQRVQLTDVPDKLVWRWTTDGQYSSKSCYYALFQGSLVSGSWELNWKSWAPPRARFFIWLACQDRCWTGERITRRRLPHRPRCVFCDQVEETMSHILTGCPFSRTIWHEVLSWIRSTDLQFLKGISRSGGCWWCNSTHVICAKEPHC